VLQPECIFREMVRQQLHREFDLDREFMRERELAGWTLLRCGYCFRKHPGRESPVIGEGTGRRVVTEFREVTWPHWPSDDAEVGLDNPDFGPSLEELLALSKTLTTQAGLLHQVSRDAPRVSASGLRADVTQRNPHAGPRELTAIYEDELSRRRTRESPNRLTVEDVEIEGGHSTITCWDCGKTVVISRKLLARKITESRTARKDVYVAPWGIELR
jgi:hypothetical protein